MINEINDRVKKWILKCAVVFPGYGQIDAKVMALKAEVFIEMFIAAGLCVEDVDRGFRQWLTSGTKFPTPADIICHSATVTAYRMDHGPEGWGAVYAADHPYVRQQMRAGVGIDQYAIQVGSAESPQMLRGRAAIISQKTAA